MSIRKTTSAALAAVLAASILTCGALAAAEPETEYLGGSPTGLYLEEDGSVIITDTYSNTVLALKDGKTTVLAGKEGAPDINGEPIGGYSDTEVADALFSSPWAVAPFLDGYAVTDRDNNVVRYIGGGRVRTVAGSGKTGFFDAVGRSARFDTPTGIAADGNGSIYIADTGNNAIRRITRSGNVSTYAVGAGDSALCEPTGLCWHDGALYIADTGNNRICKVKNGYITVLAGGGSGPDGDYVNGSVSEAKFSSPMGVCVADDGTVYVADTGNRAVRIISGGYVTTLCDMSRNDDSIYPVSPTSVLLCGDKLYISDCFSGLVLSVSTVPSAMSFADVTDSDWYYDAVSEVYSSGLFEGVSEARFEPEQPMDRGMFAVVLGRLESQFRTNTIIAGDSRFADVSEEEYYFEPTAWAADTSLAEGKADGIFAPKDIITRQEMIVMLCRYAASRGMDVSGDGGAALSKMSRTGELADWAYDAMVWAAANGIVTGGDNGELAPTANATRAQAAQILKGFLAFAAGD